MPLDSNSNAPASGQTSRSEPQSTPPDTPATENESAFLDRQVAEAKRAVQHVLSDVASDLAHGADPRAWLKVAPWTTLASAALTGFVATAAVVPSKEQQTLKRLRKIELALREDADRERNERDEDDDRERPRRRSSFLTMLAGQFFRSIQPVVMSAISAGLAAKASQPQPPTGGADGSSNGRDTAPAGAPGEMPDI